MGLVISTIVLGVSTTVGGLLYLDVLSQEVALGVAIISIAVVGLIINKLRTTGVIRTISKHAPLSGVKVLDLANVLAAPWGATNMGFLGAEVITVENLGLIDSARGLGSSPARGMAGCFAVTGRGKQSIIIDLKTDEGREIFSKFVKEVDVVLQNFRPGVADRLGVGYDDCKEWNPNIIYLSSSGFGSSGPKSGERIYDPVIQCGCGAGDIQKYPSTGQPCLVGNAVVDKISALTNFQAMVAALVARKNGRGGQHIKSAMLDAALQFFWCDGFLDYTWEGTEIDDSKRFLERVPNDIPGLKRDKSLIQSPAEIIKNPKLQHHFNMNSTLLFKGYRSVDFPIKFANQSLPTLPPPAMLGEHTYKILKELGYSGKEIDGFLKSKSVVSTASLCEMKKDMTKKKIFNIIEDLQSGSANTFADVKRFNDTPEKKDNTTTGGPLAGYKVVEFAHMAAGPLATMVLADQGAEVMKLETEDCLDPSRRIGHNSDKQMGSMFMTLNRNKKCVIVNDNLGDLLANADVFVVDKNLESRLGISYSIAKKMKKDIIYVRIDKGRGEYYCQAISGCAGTQFDADGKTNIWIEGLQIEKSCGMLTAGSITSALYANQGNGDCIDVDLENASLYINLADNFWSQIWQKPEPKTAGFPTCDEIFQFVSTKDDMHLFCGALGDNEFNGLIETFGSGEGPVKSLIEAGKYNTLGERLANINGFWSWWGQIVSKFTYEDYLPLREKSQIFSSEVLTRKQVIADEQVKHSNIVRKIVHPTLGTYHVPKPAANFLGTPTCDNLRPALAPGASNN